MQPGRRIVAGSGNQTAYVAPNGATQAAMPAREGALAAEALELQRQQSAAARPAVVIVATPLMSHTRSHSNMPGIGPYYAAAPAPQERVALGQHSSGATHYASGAAAQERAPLNGRVKKQH